MPDFRRAAAWVVPAALAATPTAAALPEGPPPTLATAWSLTAWTLVPLVLAGLGYAWGWRRLQAGRPTPRPVAGKREGAAFVAGVLAVAMALVWPLEAFAAYSLAAHVAQHMTLLALAPALLVAGRPLVVAAHGLPRAWRRGGAVPGGSGRSAAGTALGPATAAHVAVMLLWHLPAATAAALASEGLHRAMAASALGAGLWFWSALWHRLHARGAGVVGGLVALVTVMMMMGFLGALLTFSPRLLYPAYTDRGLLLGLDPLRDQQLAGLLMWVPAGLPYVAMGLALAVALLRHARTHAASADPEPTPGPTRPGAG